MKRMNVYLDEALWEAFRIMCLKHHITASKQVGLLLVQFLHEQECERKSRLKPKNANL